jgi:hypothetical protein
MLSMKPTSILQGDRYGCLTVVEELPKRGRERMFRCRCDCGTSKPYYLTNLRGGKSTACVECRTAALTKHGLTGRDKAKMHPAYGVHKGMMARCYNPDHVSFKDYGARGVRVCPEWHDVVAFCEWVDANLSARKTGETLNRIDNERGYESGNVEWADWRKQNRNRRNVVLDPEIVREIRRLRREEGLGGRRIGRRLGLNEGTVNAVLKGQTWADVD